MKKIILLFFLLTLTIPQFTSFKSLAFYKDLPKNFDLLILIDRNPQVQSIEVFKHGQEIPILSGKVSTGRETFDIPTNFNKDPYCSITPKGEFTVERLREEYLSSSWLKKDSSGEYAEGVSMPYSIFFKEGIAIHAVNQENIKKLGTKASGGCVRVDPKLAKDLFSLIALKDSKGKILKVNPKLFDQECIDGVDKSFCHDEKQWPVKRQKLQVKIRIIDSRSYEEQLAVEKKCQDQSRKYYSFKQKCLNQEDNEGLFGCHKEYYSALKNTPRTPASKKSLN